MQLSPSSAPTYGLAPSSSRSRMICVCSRRQAVSSTVARFCSFALMSIFDLGSVNIRLMSPSKPSLQAVHKISVSDFGSWYSALSTFPVRSFQQILFLFSQWTRPMYFS